MLDKLFSSLARRVGIRFLLRIIKEAAEGKRGARAHWLYWKLAGAKTITGGILWAVWFIASHAGFEKLAVTSALVGTIAIAAGLTDKAYRSDAPRFVMASRLYKALVSIAPIITIALGSLWWYIGTLSLSGSCSVLSCADWQKLLLGVAALLVQLKLSDPAWKAQKPTAPPGVRA